MRKLKRIFIILFVAVATALAITPSVKKTSAATLQKVTVHYYRYNNDYKHFGWFWTASTKGQTGMMTKASTKLGSAAKEITFDIPEGTEDEEFGLLFCYSATGTAGAWGGEQTSDYYFYKSDLKEIENGVGHVYYIQAEEYPVYTLAEAQEKMKDKFIYLSFDSAKTITCTPSRGSVTDLKLTADGANVDVTFTNSKITLKNQTVDFTKEYVVNCKVNGTAVTQQVTFQSLYQSATWNDAYGYDGDDLGATYTPTSTTFKLWAPISKEITLNLFHYGHPTEIGTTEYPGDDTPYQTYQLEKGEKGVWSVEVPENLDGVYYTYTVKNSDITINEIVDPYAKSTGVNGMRGMVVNFAEDNDKLNPAKWAGATRAASGANVDSVIYETHVRDLTAHSSWGGNKKYSGTFLGLAQTGTK